VPAEEEEELEVNVLFYFSELLLFLDRPRSLFRGTVITGAFANRSVLLLLFG